MEYWMPIIQYSNTMAKGPDIALCGALAAHTLAYIRMHYVVVYTLYTGVYTYTYTTTTTTTCYYFY